MSGSKSQLVGGEASPSRSTQAEIEPAQTSSTSSPTLAGKGQGRVQLAVVLGQRGLRVRADKVVDDDVVGLLEEPRLAEVEPL